MKERLISLVVILVVIGSAGWALNRLKNNPRASLSASVNQYAATTVKVGNKSFGVQLATTADQQALGLGNRSSIGPGTGMLFVFKPAEAVSFWMKDMRFSLDMIWVYQDKVVAVNRNVPVPAPGTKPGDLPTYSPNVPVDYVLEVTAGEGSSIQVGDQFEVATSVNA